MTQTKLTSDERQVRNRLQEELMDKVTTNPQLLENVLLDFVYKLNDNEVRQLQEDLDNYEQE